MHRQQDSRATVTSPVTTSATDRADMMGNTPKPLRIGNFSAYYGDRTDTIDELLRSGVDILAGDYLAELTMMVLKKNQTRGADGYATGFVRQMKRYLPDIAAHGVRLVTNAGGLDPIGCAAAIEEIARSEGLDLKVAAISGDDLSDRGKELREAGEELRNLDTGESLDRPWSEMLTANAYLGAWPIVKALEAGADIVICPRVTDASLIIGPAAWHFGWNPDDLDQLAGALWAGHAIECGGQVCGGNYSFFYEHDDLGIPGMPIAEIHSDGTSIITKADDTGGTVTVDTVKAQLLYEVGAPRYLNPDVTADLSVVDVHQVSVNRVRISGARGYAAPPSVKVSLAMEGGYRNSITVGITGRRVDEKLAWLRRQVDTVLGGDEGFDALRWTVIGPRDATAGSMDEATAWAVITARASSPDRVGRAHFADAIVQLGVSSIPGCYFAAPPQREKLAGVQWPCLVDKSHIRAQVHLGESVTTVPWPDLGPETRTETVVRRHTYDAGPKAELGAGSLLEAVSLGDLFGTRSGDKAGVANLGVWARSVESWVWLRTTLTIDALKTLIPEIAELRVERHEMGGIWGLNFVIYDFLERGVATSVRVDSQAKGLGEFLGSRTIEVPTNLLISRSI